MSQVEFQCTLTKEMPIIPPWVYPNVTIHRVQMLI